MRGRAYVVEDVAEERAVLANLLGELGYEPVFPGDPDDSVAAALASAPRLIVLSADVKNGFGLCLRFKKDAILRRVPLLLTTSRASPEVIRKHRLLPTRADAYLRKPLDTGAFRDALTELLPEDFSPDAPPPFPGTDRTIVSQGALDSAVLTYVDEEVRTLKEVVARLQSEKAELNQKLGMLEDRMQSQNEILDSGLKSLREMQEPRSRETPAIREAAYEAGRAAGLEEARAAAEVELDAWKARAAELEQRNAELAAVPDSSDELRRLQELLAARDSELADARSREEDARRSLDENLALFERLEAGYKNDLDAGTAEKTNLEERLAVAEAEADRLQARMAEIEKDLAAVPQLREAAEARGRDVQALKDRISTLDGEIVGLNARLADAVPAREKLEEKVREAEARAAEFEVTNAAMAAQLVTLAGVQAELERARTSESEALAEVARLQERLSRLKSFLVDEGGTP